ncbi:hypothetical protein C4572_00015 [Candidatus Parcubacteria bacterium]|nr:MAG: hypothetical protein C4572_00015 [Candidatus Parcubacteria bacterium]
MSEEREGFERSAIRALRGIFHKKIESLPLRKNKEKNAKHLATIFFARGWDSKGAGAAAPSRGRENFQQKIIRDRIPLRNELCE